MIDKCTAILFQPDYLIAWDFNNQDFPCVNIVRLERDRKGTQVVADVIGLSHEKSGVVSLRQLLEQYDFNKREDEKRAKERHEFLNKNLHIPKEAKE